MGNSTRNFLGVMMMSKARTDQKKVKSFYTKDCREQRDIPTCHGDCSKCMFNSNCNRRHVSDGGETDVGCEN